MMYLLFFIFLILYLFAEGLTEGYTWADKERRENNALINPNKLDYHFWRLMENAGILGSILVASFAIPLTFKFCIFLLGAWIFGVYMIYERALDYVDHGHPFPPNSGDYHLLGKVYKGAKDIKIGKFKINRAKEILQGLVGLLIMFGSFLLT